MILPEKVPETGILRDVWRRMNALREYVASLRLAPGRYTHVRHTTLGQAVDVDLPTIARGGTDIRTFRIRTIEDDSLTCVHWDGETEGAQVTVARPWTLRRYVYEALSGGTMTFSYVGAQERIASDGTNTERHLVTKAYVEQEMIVAAKLETIQPADANAKTELYKTEHTWNWLDLNMDGRDWARAPEE